MARVIRRSYKRTLQEVFERYRRENGREPVSTDEVAVWAIDNGLIIPPRPTQRRLLARHLADALKHERVTDPQGRTVRRWHSERKITSQGEQLVLWDDIDHIKPPMMRASLQQRRSDIAHDMKRLVDDQDSYNDNNPYKAKLPPIVQDLGPDVEEMRAAETYPNAPDNEKDEDGV